MNNDIEAIKAIKVELDKIKESGSLSNFFKILDNGLLPSSGKSIKKEHRYMAFLLCIDAISQKLYSKDSENGYYAIELSKYTNGKTGYFDLLFKHASLLIRDLIFDEVERSLEKDDKFKDYKMNVILKMDTHNNPQGKSKYSLITHTGDFFITDDNCNSLAYTLFFDYSLFCNSKKDDGELTDDEIYTVHKEFINEKTARSFAYQFESVDDEQILIKYIDGYRYKETDINNLGNGEKHYKDFISYILNKDLIINDASDFSNYLIDSNTDNSWKKGNSLSSFSYYNLGIPGFESWGTLMIECNKDVQTVYEKFYRRGGENDDTLLLSQIKNVISALKKIDDEYNDALNKQKIRRESEKSAKAAIMSRNMSHNIGSHVMSYLKQHLGSVKDIIADGILSDLINGENELAKKLENTTENTTLPFLMGLGQFISYLQERQDFIATISTDYIPYFGNVNFKDAIYDELNPDKRAERHSERTNGKTNNILLGNIARSEGIGRKTAIKSDKESNVTDSRDIILKFREHFNGDKVVEIDENGNEKEILNQDAYNELKEMRKYDFSLPGGIVGRQAFFSIMENIIRNAAKHGNLNKNNNLEFTFDIYSNKEEDIKRLPSDDNINDNCLSLKEVIEKYYLKASDAKDLYFITITDNCEMAPLSANGEPILVSLGKLRNALISNYINEAGEMENENKGLKEMRISAAWMRAIKDESMCFSPFVHVDKNTKVLECEKNSLDANVWKEDNFGHKAPLVYARITCKKEQIANRIIRKGRNLQFIFCVQIPKKVAVIINDKETEIKTIKDNLERINWRAYTVDEFLVERNKSYEFILIDDQCKNIKQTYFNVRSEATSRTYLLSEIKDFDRNDFINRLKDKNYDGKADLNLLYQSLANYQEGDMIAIDDKIASKRNKNLNNIHLIIKDGIDEKVKYLYCRHHDSDREFTEFMRSQKKDSAFFVEGISGNNSTDRLVRNETLDDSWFYRHLRAMKQQIAIFDERLFSKITKLEESNFNDSDIVLCKDNMALSYLQRGVYPYTLIADKKKKRFYLIGLLHEGKPKYNEELVKDDCQSPIYYYKCHCGCIANITFKDNKLNIECNANGKYATNHFHSMTIHQGLLDKIYELFEIKGSSLEKELKEAVTSKIFETFSNKKEIVIEEGGSNSVFLPGIIIHSGRSKPNESDMPQKLPFIQYAALEHAVMDCKYSLVELLDYARYES